MKLKNILKEILLKVIPIKKNRIVFMSFNGHYSDSPKYICEKIHEIDSTYELIWLVNKKYKNLVPSYAKAVEYPSKKALYYYASAHKIIDNVYGEKEIYLRSKEKIGIAKYKILNFLKTKKNQYVYTTWHGMPVKKMQRDQVGIEKIYDFECPNTTMIVGTEHAYRIMNHITFEKLNMKLMGEPRNDILYNKDIKYKNKMKQKLGLPIDKKIILFAPTFRTDAWTYEKNINRSGINQLKEINFDKLFYTLNQKFGDDWVFICRFHYHVEQMLNWNDLKKRYGNKIINGNKNDDMAEYLLCTDILLSDISSCLYDFFITKKPTFSFFPDFDYYKDEERGLYINVEDFPFNISKTFDELILDIETFDNNYYVKKLHRFMEKKGYISDSKSSMKIAKFILEEREEK